MFVQPDQKFLFQKQIRIGIESKNFNNNNEQQ